MKNNQFLLALVSVLALTGCGQDHEAGARDASATRALECADCNPDRGARGGRASTARGAFTCDFAIPRDFPGYTVPTILERDRMYMADRPGMLQKHVPIRLPGPGEDYLAGGRYLFDTERHAEAYEQWVDSTFELDGVLFLDRWYFIRPDCHAWRVIGAHDFGDIHEDQVVLRTERWLLPEGEHEGLLQSRWLALKNAAAARGMTSVWLLYNRDERLASVVYFADHVSTDRSNPDFDALYALEKGPALGLVFADRPWEKVMDRTQFVWTIWFPFVLGDQGEASVWPNEPALPLPYIGDGLCVVSRGEDNVNAPMDCPATCGNGVADPDETYVNCPGDVRIF